MKIWLSRVFLGLFVLAAPACSGNGRQFGAHAGAGGMPGTSGGGSSKGGGPSSNNGGRSGTSGAPSSQGGSAGDQSTQGGSTGDGMGDAGAAGDTGGTPVGCGGVVCAAEAQCTGAAPSAHCVCPSGYTDPRGDGTLCQDVDECANLNGGCNSLVTCKNTPGSFSCGDCPAGYTAGANGSC